MVFLVIAATVFVQGLGGGMVAGLLGVRRPSNHGFLIAGANPLARELARALQAGGEDVVLVETDGAEVAAAQREGLTVVMGNALDEEVLEAGDLAARRGVVGLIRNEGVSLLVAEKAVHDFRVGTAYIAIRPDRAAVPMDRLRAVGARVLFGGETDIAYWAREIRFGRGVVQLYQFVGEEAAPADLGGTNSMLPLVVERKGQVLPVDDQTRFKDGDRVALLHNKDVTPPSMLRSSTEAAGLVQVSQ